MGCEWHDPSWMWPGVGFEPTELGPVGHRMDDRDAIGIIDECRRERGSALPWIPDGPI